MPAKCRNNITTINVANTITTMTTNKATITSIIIMKI